MKNNLSDIKILVAEDNDVNRLIAKKMLEQWNVQCTTVGTGNEVLEIFETENFDIVLMDIQMPEKNGIETTIAIRQLEHPIKKAVPIIALTANGLLGEEEKLLKCGINDFLIKPFSSNDLLQLIRKHLSEPSQLNEENTTMIENSPNGANVNLYDLKLVYEIAENNEEFVRTLLQIYLDTIPATSEEMLKEARANNWETAGKLAHKLKSTIDTMLIVSIQDDVRTVERCGKTQTDTHLMLPLSEKIDKVVNEVANQFKANFQL